MHPYHYPIPKLTIALICGIFLSSYVSLEIDTLLIVLGVFISQLHHPKAQKNHYSYFLKKEKASNLLLSITKEMSPTTYNYRYIAKILE